MGNMQNTAGQGRGSIRQLSGPGRQLDSGGDCGGIWGCPVLGMQGVTGLDSATWLLLQLNLLESAQHLQGCLAGSSHWARAGWGKPRSSLNM